MMVLEDNVEARDAMRDKTMMVIIPSFQKFTHKQKDKEFSKSRLLFIMLLLLCLKPHVDLLFKCSDPQKCELNSLYFVVTVI